MVATPFAGWTLVSVSVLGIPTVLYDVLPWPDPPLLPSLPDRAPVEAAMKIVHARAAYALIALAGLTYGQPRPSHGAF